MRALKVFEASDYLKSDEEVAEFLSMFLEDPNPDVRLRVFQAVAKAREKSRLAQDSGIGRA